MLLEQISTRMIRWLAATAVVAALHLGALAFALREPPEDDEESQTGGAFIIELSPITTSPEEERRDVAVGQTSEDVKLVVAPPPQQAAAALPEPQPDEPPAPVVPDPPPEAVAVKPPDEQPPEEIKPPEAAAQASSAPTVTPVAASEAAAPQEIENAVKKGTTARGQNVGQSSIDRRAIENWQRDLTMHINRHKRYPSEARNARQQGRVSVAFTIDREGRVIKAAVATSAGYELLDKAAVDMLNRASPLPAPPASMAGDTLSYVVPVLFRWSD